MTAHAPQTAPDEPAAPAGPSVFLETFGCQMNVLDTQLVTGQLRALGYRFTDDWRAADVVLYNTCSVREHAEAKVWSRVGLVGKHKANRPGLVLGVIGCMAERDGADMLKRYPQIDLLCGPGELDKVPMLIDNAIKTTPADRATRPGSADDFRGVALQGNTHRRSATLAAAEDQLELIDLSRSFAPDDQLAAGRSAYVRITRGCNKFCTYCVVPHTRGAEVHRPPDHIVDECRKLADAGVIEVTLLGQTVNHYHYDTAQSVSINGVAQPQVGAAVKNRGNSFEIVDRTSNIADRTSLTTFAQLLARIHDEVPALQRIRFVTSFPRDFGDDILRTIADRPRLCAYLHLPVQSGSDRMLKAMNRGYTVAEYLELIDRVRDILPGAEIATDIIVGFPGETEADHHATADLLQRCRFKNSFIFKYSPRPGTAAYDRLPDDVPDTDKKRRNNELLAIQAQVSRDIHAAYVGRTVDVFVESISSKARKAALNAADPSVTLGWESPVEVTQLTGRTEGDLITCFDGSPDLIGSIVPVTITSSGPLILMGDLASTP